MFPVHRSLIFAIALLVCIVAAAPLQHPSSVDHASHTSQATEAARQIRLQTLTPAVTAEAYKHDSQQPTSLASKALTTASQLFASFNKKTKESSGSTQSTHFRRRVRVVRRHP